MFEVRLIKGTAVGAVPDFPVPTAEMDSVVPIASAVSAFVSLAGVADLALAPIPIKSPFFQPVEMFVVILVAPLEKSAAALANRVLDVPNALNVPPDVITIPLPAADAD